MDKEAWRSCSWGSTSAAIPPGRTPRGLEHCNLKARQPPPTHPCLPEQVLHQQAQHPLECWNRAAVRSKVPTSSAATSSTDSSRPLPYSPKTLNWLGNQVSAPNRPQLCQLRHHCCCGHCALHHGGACASCNREDRPVEGGRHHHC